MVDFLIDDLCKHSVKATPQLVLYGKSRSTRKIKKKKKTIIEQNIRTFNLVMLIMSFLGEINFFRIYTKMKSEYIWSTKWVFKLKNS